MMDPRVEGGKSPLCVLLLLVGFSVFLLYVTSTSLLIVRQGHFSHEYFSNHTTFTECSSAVHMQLLRFTLKYLLFQSIIWENREGMKGELIQCMLHELIIINIADIMMGSQQNITKPSLHNYSIHSKKYAIWSHKKGRYHPLGPLP